MPLLYFLILSLWGIFLYSLHFQELFGVVGPLKKAKLLKSGAAEVVYSTREDALKAVQKYHSRELDGKIETVEINESPYELGQNRCRFCIFLYSFGLYHFWESGGWTGALLWHAPFSCQLSFLTFLNPFVFASNILLPVH